MVKCTLVIIEFVLENKQETDINEMYLGLQKKKQKKMFLRENKLCQHFLFYGFLNKFNFLIFLLLEILWKSENMDI